MSSSLSSKTYSERMRNCFLILSWIIEHRPACIENAFLGKENGKEISTIVYRMINLYKNQKKGRKPNKFNVITGKEATLLWFIRDETIDNSQLIKNVYSYGLNLVDYGLINITPDDNLDNWVISLSPSGKLFADHLENF